MKLSTKKILLLETMLLVLMLALACIPMSGVLREYLRVAALAAALVASVILLGWAKPRGREVRIVTIVVLLSAVFFQAAYWTLVGLKLGFLTNIYAWNLTSIFTVFLPVVATITLSELLRGQLIEKGKSSRAVIIMTTAMLIIVETVALLPIYDLSLARGWFDLAIVAFAPAILSNILLTYLAYTYDYRIGLVYRLIMSLPGYFLPVIPAASPYLAVLFQVMLVVALLLGLIYWQKVSVSQGAARAVAKLRTARKRPLTSQQQKALRLASGITGGVLISVVIIYTMLMSGLFQYYFLAIGSGSMSPEIERGDLILVKKSRDFSGIAAGDVLVYHRDDATIVHRVASVSQRDHKYYYRTQGDANATLDTWEISEDEVVGTVTGKIIAFGFPTLWLNELFNGGKI